MRTGRLSFILVAGLAAWALGCGVGSAAGTFEPSHPGTLTVLTQPLPTAGFWDGSGTTPTGGMEYGMALELARRLGLGKVQVETRPFAQIVAGELGDADLAMSLITPTDRRRAKLDFTTPYIRSPTTLLVRAGTEIPDVQTAQELRWVVERDTTFERTLADVIRPDAAPLRAASRDAVLDALASGDADVAPFDLPAAAAIAHTDPRFAVAARLDGTEPIAAALPKGSPNTEAVGSALRAMQADGTLGRLGVRWLGGSFEDLSADVPLLRTGAT